MDLDTFVFLLSLIALFVALFLLRLRYFERYSKIKEKIQRDQELFLTTFDPSGFVDFDAFTFQVGSFSHVSPFPAQSDGEWRYTIYLASKEVEDTGTIVHELTECTLGRVIEKLLDLKKPLYLQRKQDEKFWVTGQRQKYILEHLLATISEFDDIPKEKQEERIAPEDIKIWQIATKQTRQS
ncbi:MAG TPA: hypothetical protein VK487_01670 [Candidatus Bathyarchaeia archaeon]|nr:hypothetical protein [Candidatus Bathyarchaeia archaeon]